MVISLVVVNGYFVGYFIGGCQWLFRWWVLMVILFMIIGGYSINGYQCTLVVIVGYYINGYWWLLY